MLLVILPGRPVDPWRQEKQRHVRHAPPWKPSVPPLCHALTPAIARIIGIGSPTVDNCGNGADLRHVPVPLLGWNSGHAAKNGGSLPFFVRTPRPQKHRKFAPRTRWN